MPGPESGIGRILVLGNAGIDICLTLPHLPRPGESLLGKASGRTVGGKGLNQAVVASRCGAAVVFCAPVGSDADAEMIGATLVQERFEHLLLSPMPFSTDFSWLLVSPDGENIVVGAGPCAAAFTEAQAVEACSTLRRQDLLLVQGNFSQEATLAALSAATSRGARTMFNAAPLWWDARPLLAKTQILVVNRGEAETLTGEADPRKAIHMLGCQGGALALVTLGREGCLSNCHGEIRHHSAVTAHATDTTGCGDTFCGVLAAMLLKHNPIDDAVALAQGAAAITATRPGAYAALPGRDEMRVTR